MFRETTNDKVDQKSFQWLYSLWLIVFAFVAISNPLFSEIQKVSITWNNVLCDKTCGQLLDKWLKENPSIADVRLNWQNGQADLIWKPTQPFDYYPIHYAMAKVGLHLDQMTMQLRATISHSDKHYFATSVGDGTKIELFGPLRTSTSQFVEKYNLINYPLQEETIQLLQSAENKHQVVKIEGSLYMPSRPPLHLIVNSVKIETVD